MNRCIAYVVLLLLSLGCDGKQGSRTVEPESQSENELTIEPGYGIAKCHIGMPKNQLGASWESGKVLYPETYGELPHEHEVPLINRKLGISCAHVDQTIQSIAFSYRVPGLDYGVFRGNTREGIGKTSTIPDVLSAYGEPSYISNITDAENNRDFSLWYERKGVAFDFCNDELESIWITKSESSLYSRETQVIRES